MNFTPLKQAFHLLASLKTAIPLLVFTIMVTVAGSLFPDPDFFRSAWYLGLLGINGLSLLFVTILHIPALQRRRGRQAMIGVVFTHLGILVLIAGIIHGGTSAVRHKVRLIEGQTTVIPGLPFVMQLEKLVIEDYPPGAFGNLRPEAIPRKTQDSHITLLKQGKRWKSVVAAPGNPASVGDMKILPSVNDTGWYFELIITETQRKNRKKTIPIKPWAPPLVRIGERNVMAHSMMDTENRTVEILAIDDDGPVSLGHIDQQETMAVGSNIVSLGAVRRYTAASVYNRPQAPILVAGSVMMLAGLVWHFYFRHRDRERGRKDEHV